ncbi:hypothetical protein BMJ34_13335 [Sinorhizobium medicae]|uniref:Uncharacterized protein n=1 Tax=Sinorhizobium medicae TaxID=110321 RepID=A0ABX4TR12_9HYPH|nr:hypothetical protein [Sinorhizobium meliloti]PLU01025.1 hypothetical protein BMJ34_13335 [Sinorhizobium medicae]MDW9844815.1 hypothetical protein [Sinorhizobium meliloti]MDX0141843.1 hypothetical protein [Sinorhizobium meliloti]MDX0147906.1 hypothetical protein [Sinorhizobium meliloti]
MDCKDVTEFIVVPPVTLRADIWAAKERFADALSRQFPGYSFRIARIAPVDTGECFGVYPVMNFVGADNQAFMCNEPPSWLLGEIRMACQAFDLRKGFAA